MDAEPLGFDGIVDYAKRGDVRLVWVHGMCDHSYTWAQERRQALYEALGAVALPSTSLESYVPGEPYPVRGVARVNGANMTTDYLVWSPLSTAYKDRLAYDDLPSRDGAGKFPYQRASLNRSLKQTLINRCLIDAVVYAGENGDVIRQWIKSQVCAGLGGSDRQGRCRFASGGAAPNTVLVAESLGSKLLADALRSIWAENERSARAAEQLSSVQAVFLLANQIPLLDAADQPAATFKSSASSDDFLSVLTNARSQRPKSFVHAPLRKLQVIAFSDPNDLLSYRLKDDGNIEGAQVTNVLVSNAPTYLGLLEMPDAAHCGYKWNRYVVGAVAFGFHGGIKPLPYDLPKECGLIGGS